jgi:hypothetical protein
MSLYEILIDRWDPAAESLQTSRILEAIEGGQTLSLPRLGFSTAPGEAQLFTPAILGSAKNASYDAGTDRLGGTKLAGADADALRGLMRRFTASAASLVAALLPSYRGKLVQARASFRPAEIAGRATSWRKDDTRLHVDSFPATPTGGRRILRVFTNVNPESRPRTWRIGGAFEATAQRFEPQLRMPWPGSARALAFLRVTKTLRSPYDALMLQLHDAMKADEEFQRGSEQQTVDFPAGSTWLAFTDEVSHAAMSGQYQLEQTFLLPVAAMREPERSPLRVLERLKGRRLASAESSL